MTQLLLDALRQFRDWDRPAQSGLAMALVLLVPVFFVAAAGPQDLRRPATFSAMALIFVAQAIFLWANRTMVTPYTKAQRQFRAGDFNAVLTTLEPLYGTQQADFRVLTLLGNAYRQLGRLPESHTVLYEAVHSSPDHYFPLYGFGRTLLCEGAWSEAVTYITRALDCGAPAAVRFDLAEAHYAAGDVVQAVELYRAALIAFSDEPHRLLMAQYRLHRHAGAAPPQAGLLAAGLPYWEEVADVHRAAPYGEQVAQDLVALRALVREG